MAKCSTTQISFGASGGGAFKRLQTNPNRFVIPLCAFLSFFTLSFTTSSLVIQPQGTKAITGLGLVTAPTMALTSSGNVDLSVTPTLSGALTSDSHTLTANTNVPTGYNLTLTTTATSTLSSTTGTFASPTVLANNSWGYALANIGNFDPTYAIPTPSTTSKWANPNEGATIKNTANSTTSDNTIIYYGAKVDTTQPSGTYSNTVRYTATANLSNIPSPTIISITPSSGTTAGGTAIQIVGTGFAVNDESVTTAVTVGGSACTSVTISSNTPTTGQDTIYCNTPAHAAGAVNVAVTTWSNTATSTNGYTYITPATVTFVSPNQASTIAGTESGPAFTIAGTGFTGATSVTIGGTACANFEVVSDAHIFCKAPNTINTTGNKAIAVTKTTVANTGTVNISYNSTAYPTFQSGSAYANCATTAKLYRDTRDSQLYYVKKMPDNKCWMVDNLKYANYGTLSQETGKYLTVNGTDTQSTANSDVAKYVDPGADSYCTGNTNLPTNTNTKCGLLYNWYAATRGTGAYAQSMLGTNVTGNICPTNFRLPSSMSGGESILGSATSNGTGRVAADFPLLGAAMYTGSIYTVTMADIDAGHPEGWQPTGAWGGAYSGLWHDGLSYQGSTGYFWSSTASSNEFALGLSLEGITGSNFKWSGLAVRCVMDAPVYNFSYTGAAQTFTVPNTGTYQVELWGAGGRGAGVMDLGLGGYTKGVISLAKNETLYLYVGGPYATSAPIGQGGWNGGGNHGNGNGYGANGATDVRLVQASPTNNTVWNESVSLRSRIMVAGAAGGYSCITAGCTASDPNAVYDGNGGGLIGGRGHYNPSDYVSSTTLATQISGHQFGVGGSGSAGNTGGGGGYYGGMAGLGSSGQSGSGWSGGGGGSSYISGHTGAVAITSASDQAPKAGCATGTTNNACSIHYSGKNFTNTLMIDGGGYRWTNTKGALQAMPNPAGGNYASGKGNPWGGYARITYLGS